MTSVKSLAVLILMSGLAACTSAPTDMQPVGGNRSQGVVYLSYEYGVLSDAEPDYARGQATARDRCVGWGYSGAEPFYTSTRRCADRMCWTYVVTIPYQCTGPRR